MIVSNRIKPVLFRIKWKVISKLIMTKAWSSRVKSQFNIVIRYNQINYSSRQTIIRILLGWLLRMIISKMMVSFRSNSPRRINNRKIIISSVTFKLFRIKIAEKTRLGGLILLEGVWMTTTWEMPLNNRHKTNQSTKSERMVRSNSCRQ